MTKTGWALAIVTLLILVAAVILFILPGKTAAPTVQNGQAATTPAETKVAQIPGTIIVSTPLINGTVGSASAQIAGSARGWYFEASFPVEIRDAQGAILAQAPAQAQGDWMTTEFVPFVATITYPAQPAGSSGTIILRKDNPSGLAENDQSLEIPIVFR